MNFQKPSSKGLRSTAALVGGAVAGGAISRGVMGAIHKAPDASATEAEKKKNNTMGYVKRAGIAVVSAIGAAAVKGDDIASTAVKGALVGMAVVQTLEIIRDAASTNTSTAKLANSTKSADKFAARVLGLGCPGDNMQLNGYKRRKASLRMPETIDYPQYEEPTQVLSLASPENPFANLSLAIAN